MTTFDPSVRPVLEDLRSRYPDARFLALGQTVWWDEPMKAVLRRMLDDLGLGGSMVLGVHDTDYFAKVKFRQAGQSRFEMLPHNDGSTKDLWSAAGEISRLFGSETVPTRQDYLRHGVPFDMLARRRGDAAPEFIDEVTEAWGWRGLVYTGSRDRIVHDLPLAEVGEAIERLVEWGVDGTIESIADECCKREARALSDLMIKWVRDYRHSNNDKNLNDLYQHLFPRLFCLLLGRPPRDVEVTCTTSLLRLTPETASLPRFDFVDLFLREETRAIARAAYDHAVSGSEMYKLDRFGLGALPFDVVVPGYGRGNLRVTLRSIHIETKVPIRINLRSPINGVAELAEALQHKFGENVTLVGKAVALISMLAREFIFVFSEEGSAYVHRTQRMNDYLRENGVDLIVHPILRLRYPAWDALDATLPTLKLPDHLASTFARSEISTAEFASVWERVVDEQKRLLDELTIIRRPRDLFIFLAGQEGNGWSDRASAYETAKQEQKAIWGRASAIQQQMENLYTELKKIKTDIRMTEHLKGDHFRATVDWPPDEVERRGEYDEQIELLLSARRDTISAITELNAQRLEVERSNESKEVRRVILELEVEAQEARLKLVRNALLTTGGLTHTQHRPTAWWLPMVDRTGGWFRRIVETTQIYPQPLVSE